LKPRILGEETLEAQDTRRKSEAEQNTQREDIDETMRRWK
jgi:hypothetical protein